MKEIITLSSRIDKFDVDIFKPDNWNNEKLFLFCHGFNSGKNSEAYKIIGEVLIKHGIAYAIFSLPYHAERRSDYLDFTVENCIEDIDLVENSLRNKYPNTKIGILGTSFGGYLTLLRMHRAKHDYFLAVLKSPAIRMGAIFRSFMSDKDFDFFKNNGFIINNLKDDGMKITYDYYEELINNDVMNFEYNEPIILYHGTIDDTAPYKDSAKFAESNKNVVLHPLEGENHRFSMETLLKFSEEIVEMCNEK